MRRDPKAFRERFAAWKNGEQVYDAGRIVDYAGGKDAEYWDAVKDFVSQHEGFKDTTYLDGKGIPTIGYGFTDPALTKRGKISRAEADKYLINRLRKEDLALRDSLSNWDLLGTDAKKALISYRYNYPAGFKDTTNFMKYWNAGDYMNAIKEVDAGWNDTANPGLRMRREAEQALLRADPFLSGNANVNIPVETSTDPVFNKPAPLLDFTAPRLSTDVNQPFRTVSADKKIDDSAGWKAISHLLTLDILKALADGYDWQMPKLPPLLPLRANQWTLSLIGYEGGKDALPGYTTGEDGGFFNWLKNSLIGASVADATAVATASGWHNEDGQWRLNRTAADEQLGKNISAIATFSDTNPATAAINWGIKKVAPLLRLPVSKFVADAVNQSKDYKYTGNSESSKTFYKKVFGNGPLSYITGWTKTPPAGIEPSKTIRIPSWAILSIENSTIPRMIQMRPELPPNQLRNWIRNNIGETYTEFSDAAYRAAKKGDLAGLYEPAKDFVSIRQGYEDFALLHELRHKLDNAIPLTPEEVKILKQAFNDDFLNLKNTVDKYKDMDLSKEMVTSIGDMRRVLLGDQVDWSVPVAKLNELIDAARDVDIMDALMNANGYTSNYYKALIDKYGQIPSEMFGFFRNAMKKIGMFGGAVGAKKLDNNYKHGKDSGIHIKPENRGKFTALKKRTGKSASWFKAHGTPALKKMATFALNARKWKH